MVIAKRHAPRLFQDPSGSTYAMLAVALIPLMGVVGTGFDLGRAYMASSRLQSAVDAAVLAAVRMEQLYPGTGSTAGPRTTETVAAFLGGNIPPGYLSMTRQNPALNVTRAGEEITIELTVTGQVPTTLMTLFGFTQLPVRASATGVAGKTLPTAVEAMLVLDNTGSMDGNGGMPALRQSVTDFLDIIYGNRETRTNFALGMMPYNVIVNVGRLLPASRVEAVPGFTDKPATNAMGWKGCVLADPTRRNLSTDVNAIDANTFDMGKDLPGDPGVPRARPSIYPPMWVRSFHKQDNRYKLGSDQAEALSIANYEPMRTALIRRYGSNICIDNSGNNAVCADGLRVNPARLPDYSNWSAPKLYNSRVKPSNADNFVSASPNYVCPSEALPVSYSYTKSQLRDYINIDNQPLFNIGTWHNQAMAWGYRLLARDDVFTRARPTQLGLRRVLIFMTDGNFDSRDDGDNVNRGGSVAEFQRDTAYTGYGAYADRKLIDNGFNTNTASNLEAARAQHRDATALRFRKTCQAMKREGIEIYTITFAIAAGAEGDMTREMFKGCATDRNTHFFETKNAGDLRTAFTTIAADLVDLHLSK
jgi:Flp pilus assembly protein TadG